MIDLDNSSVTGGGKIIQWGAANGDNQKWTSSPPPSAVSL
ncbi:RICIN domain-containing protein [Streptomyces sp. NPDC057193]